MLRVPEFFGYIDPGSGSFLIQLLVGGLLAASLTLKSFGRKISSKLKSLFGGSEPGNTDDPAPPKD